MAPVVNERKGEHLHVFQELIGNGFVRARINGLVVDLDDAPALDKNKKHTIEAVVDRVRVKDDIAQRLAESFETALNLSDGVAQVVDMDDPELPATVFQRVLPAQAAATPLPNWNPECSRSTTLPAHVPVVMVWALPNFLIRNWSSLTTI